jgi:hypothetical protein
VSRCIAPRPRTLLARGPERCIECGVTFSRSFGLLVALYVVACGEAPAASKPPVTAAELGEPSDDVDPDVIGMAVRENTQTFQLCYESARQRNPSLAGQVEVRFVIQPDGSIGPAAVAESSLPKEVSECIARAFSRLSVPPDALPKQGGAVVAQYPMFLDPN